MRLNIRLEVKVNLSCLVQFEADRVCWAGNPSTQGKTGCRLERGSEGRLMEGRPKGICEYLYAHLLIFFKEYLREKLFLKCLFIVQFSYIEILFTM